LFAEFRRAFPDWREEIEALVAEEDTVAGRFRCSGTHLGEFQGEAPTGRRKEVEEIFFLRAKDGRAGLRIPALAGRISSYLLAGQYRTFLVSHGEG
jgi:predicted ester cyclase